MLCFARLSMVATFWLLGGSSKCGFKNWWTMILLMCGLGVITLCVFTILVVWIKTSLNEDPWLSVTLSTRPSYKDHQGTQRCKGQCRKLALSTVLLVHEPRMTWCCQRYFTNQWGAHELSIESFQKWQVSFTSCSPHSSRCRMQRVNVSQASSSIGCFLALLVLLLPWSLTWSFSGGCSSRQFLFCAGSRSSAAEIIKGKYCWVSGHIRRAYWSWQREVPT